MNKESILHKEIDLIQNCIDRMSRSSFVIKGWNLSILGIMTGFFFKEKNIWLMVVLLVINTIFWWLDAYYLREEQLYKKMYNAILEKRNNDNYLNLYNLNNKKYNTGQTIAKAMKNRTLVVMYGVVAIVSLALIALQCNENIYVIVVRSLV